MSMLALDANVRKAVPFFWVRDIQKSLRFYVDGLRFTATQQWVDSGRLRWCWLELGGVAVMLQELPSEEANSQGIHERAGAGVTIYFICQDVLAIYRDLRARGIEAGRPFVGNAMWVTEITDPDGYRLTFESPTDAAEATVFPE
ncbi:MAG TPA: VOC family protein [Gemmatimonadales bacterium]|nr:VOC family protein [Gemmatimonadales bacterium]